MKIFDAKISLEEAGLFVFLMSNLDDENYVNISISEIIKRTRLNRTWLEAHLDKLVNANLIFIPNPNNKFTDKTRIFCNYKAELTYPF